jgi:hypothetical protein
MKPQSESGVCARLWEIEKSSYILPFFFGDHLLQPSLLDDLSVQGEEINLLTTQFWNFCYWRSEYYKTLDFQTNVWCSNLAHK